MASPESVVNDVIARASSFAGLYSASADLAAWRAVTAADGVFVPGGLLPKASDESARQSSAAYVPLDYDMTAIEPPVPEIEDSILTFEGQRDFLIRYMEDALTKFFTAYYPLNEDAYDEATAKLVDMITNGGTGINPDVENQIWQRDRDRVIADGMRLDSQTLIQFSQRGYSLPAGVMLGQLQANRTDQLTKLQAQSRDVAIKQFETEIENLRFAITTATDLRIKALAAASDYIRALTSSFDTVQRIVNLKSEAKARLMSATADLYRARLTRDEIAMRVPFTVADSTIRVSGMNLDAYYKGIDAKVRAAGAAADVYGRIAQAALTGLIGIGATTISSSA
jgi:hypothetical protein